MTSKTKSSRFTFQILSKGMRNNAEVLRVQTRLKQLGFFKGVAKGNFLDMTDKAVRAFQRSKQLEVDGIVGPNTWKALGITRTDAIEGEPPWMDYARSQYGITEIQGKNHNAKIVKYFASTQVGKAGDETAWCSAFVNWCMSQAGFKGSGNATAYSWLNWGESLSKPEPGAITVIKNNTKTPAYAGKWKGNKIYTGYHVGFFVREQAGLTVLLGGNQLGGAKWSKIGGRVIEAAYPKSTYKVHGYRWPKNYIHFSEPLVITASRPSKVKVVSPNAGDDTLPEWLDSYIKQFKRLLAN